MKTLITSQLKTQLWQILRDILTFGRNLFGNKFINLGISGDRVENILSRARDILLPPSLKNVAVRCGTNNIDNDPTHDIVEGLIAISSVFKNNSSNSNIFICGIFPRNKSFSINRLIIDEVNNLLKSKYSVKTFVL